MRVKLIIQKENKIFFPVHKNSKIIKMDLEYMMEKYRSDEFNKFLNVENSIYYPKENFKNLNLV